MNFATYLDPKTSAWVVEALAHVLGQGTLIAALAAAATVAFRSRSAQARYSIHGAAMILAAACLPLSLWLLAPTDQSERATVKRGVLTDSIEPALDPANIDQAPVAGNKTLVPIEATRFDKEAAKEAAEPWAHTADSTLTWEWASPWIVAAYLAGIGGMVIRLLMGLYGCQRLRATAKPIEEDRLRAVLADLGERLRLKVLPIVAYSARVTAPLVVGVVKPAILLPAAILSDLTIEQVESFLLHELAHIRRYDHWANLLQRVIEAVLFFHPAVWWLSHQVSIEREHCCDDLAIRWGSEPCDYAESLVRLSEVRYRNVGLSGASAATLAATGNRFSQLRGRVLRVLGMPLPGPSVGLTRAGVGALLLVALTSAVLLSAMPGENRNESGSNSVDTNPGETDGSEANDEPTAVDALVKKLQGEWRVETQSSDGNEPMIAHVEADQIRLCKPSGEHPMTFSFSLTEGKPHHRINLKPKISAAQRQALLAELDFYPELAPLLVLASDGFSGIIEANDDRVRICIHKEPGGERPMIFAVNESQGMWVLKRPTETSTDVSQAQTADGPNGIGTARVSGRIIVADDNGQEPVGWFDSESKFGNSTFLITEGRFDRTFECEVQAGVINLLFFPDEAYAPAVAGPFELKAGETLNDVRVELTPGHAQTISVVTDGDQPIEGATVVAHPLLNGSTNGPVIPLTTDAKGLAILPHVAPDKRYAFRVEAPGFQKLRTEPLIVPRRGEEPLSLWMVRAQPATGIVRFPDGGPAPGTKIKQLAEVFPNGNAEKSPDPKLIATTNGEGRFGIDSFNDDSVYVLVVEALDFNRVITTDVTAGTRDAQIVLPERHDLVVRVKGDLQEVPKREGKSYVKIYQRFKVALDDRTVGTLLADIATLEPTDEGGQAIHRGLAIDLRPDAGRQQVEVMLGQDESTKKIVEIARDSGATFVEFDLRPADQKE